jgi:hypothetical protein
MVHLPFSVGDQLHRLIAASVEEPKTRQLRSSQRGVNIHSGVLIHIELTALTEEYVHIKYVSASERGESCHVCVVVRR